MSLSEYTTVPCGEHHGDEPLKCPVVGRAIKTRLYSADPDTITALLNASPADRQADEATLVVYTQDPDGALLEALLAFSLGPPFDPDRVPALTQALVEAGPEPDLVAQVACLDAAFRAPRPADPPRPSARRPRVQ